MLVVADTDADTAEVGGLVRRLAEPGGARVVGLLQAVHDPGGPVPPVPLLGTVVLAPLSGSGLHVWLRSTLRGEPTPELVRWLARRSGGLVARAERELTRLADGGHLEQGGDGGWGLSAAVLARAERARRRLPATVSSLIGRERDTARVVDLVAGRRLVTLTGAGGIGKTRLGLAAANATAEEFADGAVFVSLAEATTTDLVVSTLAGVLEVPEVADEPLSDTVIRALSGLELLLVLDNFEQVLPAGRFVADLLAAAPGVRVLVTSRQRLRLSGEQVYPVPPLPVPDLDRLPDSLEEAAGVLAASPALALFVARAEEAVYGLAFTPADVRAAAQVCCRLDGLPLAIELAAANCDVLPPAQILTQLNQRLDLPAAGPQDLPARQRTLRATMDWSFALLDPDDQNLLTRLAVFAGGCPAEAIPLAAPGDDQVPRRHAAYFAAFAERAYHGLANAEGATWYARVSREYLNLRAAYTRAMADGDTPTAARIALGMRRYWRKGWHIREGRQWHHRLLTTTTGRPLPDDVRGWLMESAAFLAVMQDDYPAARPLGEQSLRLGRQLANPDLVARALNTVGLILNATGDLDGARGCFTECVAIQQARGHHDSLLAAARGNLADIAAFDGDLDTAHELCLRTIELNRELGNLRGLAISLAILGNIHLQRGDPAAARPLLTEGMAISRQIGDPTVEGYFTRDFGRLARLEGDPVGAYRQFIAAIRLGHEVGERVVALTTFVDLIDLLSTTDPARAARMLAAAEAIRDHHGMPMTKRERTTRDTTLHRIRTTLTETQLAAALAAGHAMDLDALVADASAVDPISCA